MAITDIKNNRSATKYSKSELFRRSLWGLASPFFRLSPRIFWAWRVWVLRLFGAKIGIGVHIHPTVRFIMPWNVEIGDWSGIGDRAIIYSLGKIRIGDAVTISQNVHLCAGSHNYLHSTMALEKLPIVIEDDVWICADAFVGPSVKVGAKAVIAARAVVVKDIPSNQIWAGNPAQFSKIRFNHNRSENKDAQ